VAQFAEENRDVFNSVLLMSRPLAVAPTDRHDGAMRALRVIQRQSFLISERVRASVALELAESNDAAAAARRGHREMDDEVSRALARTPSEPPACGAGCSYCCHVHAEATMPELLAIAAHLQATRSPTELAAMIERLTAHTNVVAALDHEERWRAKIPCALLGRDGRCTIYEVRPLRCRAFHSWSVDACREAYSGIEEPDLVTSPVLDRVCDAAEEGFDRALEQRGISAAPILLEGGLLEVLLTKRESTPS
jgi:Fe-S-cluster containining protein